MNLLDSPPPTRYLVKYKAFAGRGAGGSSEPLGKSVLVQGTVGERTPGGSVNSMDPYCIHGIEEFTTCKIVKFKGPWAIGPLRGGIRESNAPLDNMIGVRLPNISYQVPGTSLWYRVP